MNKYKDLTHEQLAEKMDQADRLVAWLVFNKLGGKVEFSDSETLDLNAGRPLRLDLEFDQVYQSMTLRAFETGVPL